VKEKFKKQDTEDEDITDIKQRFCCAKGNTALINKKDS